MVPLVDKLLLADTKPHATVGVGVEGVGVRARRQELRSPADTEGSCDDGIRRPARAPVEVDDGIDPPDRSARQVSVVVVGRREAVAGKGQEILYEWPAGVGG